MASPTEKTRILLDEIVNIIEKDIKIIASQSDKKGLSVDCSLKLTRYSGALLDISKKNEVDEDEFRKSLNNLTLDELVDKAKEIEKLATKE